MVNKQSKYLHFKVYYKFCLRIKDMHANFKTKYEVPMAAECSLTVQTGPGARQPHAQWYRVSFSWVKRPGRGVNRQLHLASSLKKEYSYISTNPPGLHGPF
jgi:hypothetical protein